MPDTLSQLAEELADSLTASVSATGTYNVSPQGTYSLGGNSNTTISNGGYAFANTAITNNGISGPTWTGPYTVTSGTGVTSPWASTTLSPKIRLEGEGADIEINGVSIMKLLEERLNVMIPNPELEQEWNELKKLGDKYRKLEADLKEKARIWKALNKKDSNSSR